jgi:small conductance mechanosensitive channel
MQMKVTEPIQTVIQKLEGWLDSFIGLIPNMAVTLLLLIIFLCLPDLEANYLTGFAKTSNNKALEQLFSTVIYAAILSIGLLLCLGARAKYIIFNTRRNWCNRFGFRFCFSGYSRKFLSGIILAFREPKREHNRNKGCYGHSN